MKFFKYCFLAVLLGYCGLAQAHVGSPAVNYQGKAGAYDIVVSIMPPDVIPGIATATIFIQNYHGEQVFVQTQYFSIGKGASVPPEAAKPIQGQKGLFDCSSWLMINGPADVSITIKGAKGEGTVNIPVMSIATANRRMPLILGVALVVLGLLLFVLMVTIVSASVSDGVVKPGVTPKNVKRKKMVAMLITGFILMVILSIAAYWCRDERGRYLTYLYKPIKGQSAVIKYNGENVLHLWVDTAALALVHQSLSYVIPDHGKIMHLVLVREKTLDVFAHLHPIRQDSLNFLVNLPALPPGRYFLYGDIVSWNAFEETIIDTVDIPANPPARTAGLNNIKIKTSTDDAMLVSTPVNVTSNKQVSVCGGQGMSFKFPDGPSIVWEHKPGEKIKAKQYCNLKFHVLDAKGKTPVLQPYMGMSGHAIVVKYDGSIYAHLHPVGNFAMAAQNIIDQRMGDNPSSSALPNPKKFRDSIDRLITTLDNMTEEQRNTWLMAEMGGDKNMDMGMGKDMDKGKDMKGVDMSKGMNMPMPEDPSKCGAIVQFPYTFPGPGMYRIWMEVKMGGKIYTSAFDTEVIN